MPSMREEQKEVLPETDITLHHSSQEEGQSEILFTGNPKFDEKYGHIFQEIATGGEKKIYGAEKGSRKKRNIILKKDKESRDSPHSFSESEAQEHFRSERERYTLHRNPEYFGEHVVPTRISILPTTSARDIQQYILLRCQLAVPEILLENGEFFPLCTGYLRKEDRSPVGKTETYIDRSSICEAIVALKNVENKENIDIRKCIFNIRRDETINRELSYFIKKTEEDSAFKKAVEDFVQKAIRYANETGEIVDILGGGRSGNVMFMKRKEEWTYRMIDIDMKLPTQHPSYISLHAAREALDRLEKDPATRLSWEEKSHMINGFNFVLGINAMAAALGIKDRVHLLKNVDFEKILTHLEIRI